MGCADSKDSTATKKTQQPPAGHPGHAAPAHMTPAHAAPPVAMYGTPARAPAPAPVHHAQGPKVAAVTGSGQPCAYYMTGYCRTGTACPSLHDPSMLPGAANGLGSRNPRQGTSGKPCQYFMTGYCRAGDDCKDVHYEQSGPPPAPAARRNSTPPPAANSDRPICQSFMEGNCRYGRSCVDQHPAGLGGMESGHSNDNMNNHSFVPAPARGPPPAAAPVRPVGNICQFFLQGYCRLGGQCKDQHPAEMEGWGRGDTTDLQAILEASRQEEEQRQLAEARKRAGGGGGPPPAAGYPAPPPASGAPGGGGYGPPVPPRQDSMSVAPPPSCHPSGKTLSEVMIEDPMAVYPVFPYHATTTDKAKDPSDPSLSCSICICEFEDGEQMMMLPCMHRFHAPCVSDWVKKHPTCPICNADVRRTGSIMFTE